ncbi:MAG: carboxypeptidase regulatory-like domain-containing protein [Bacteroidales bacterium]|nr:carboxypeptidase regulatory-like domain-containing protein [Bacteroidales bacterium]
MKRMSLIFVLILLLFGIGVQAQTVINGRVSDTSGEPIPNLSVLVHIAGSDLIMAYAFSDIDGNYTISFNLTADSLDVKTNSSFFEKKTLRVPNVSQTIDFVLKEEVKQLKGVTVMAKPVEKTGDTVEYFVDSFVGLQDKSIEDVLKKMPGIEVENNGKILYQGLPIQKFYVEGMDLMDGRYSVVSKNLPHQSVASVEIYENHQPIELLRDKVSTERASINIKLSKNVTVSGTGEVGVGAYPLLWNTNITPMLFSSKLQMVTSLQSNNIGKDLLNSDLNFYSENTEERPPDATEDLAIQTASTPLIEKNRYLNNTSHFANFNILTPISPKTQMRVNLSYINDLQKQSSFRQNTYLLPDDTISYTENINNKIYDSYLKADVAIDRNDKNAYIKDKIDFSKRWNKSYGYVLNDNEDINQMLNNQAMTVSNDLRILFPVGKHLLDFVSYVSYDNMPESLEVEPGVFEDVFNFDKSYNKIRQEYDKERFYTNEALSGIFMFGGLVVSSKLGFSYYQNKIKTDALIFQDSTAANDNIFVNDVTHSYTQPYLKTKLEYKHGKATVSMYLPLSLDYAITESKGYRQELPKLFFNPTLSLKYAFNYMFKFYAYGKYEQKIDNFENYYDNIVLNNYQSITRMTAPMSVSNLIRANARLTFEQPFYAINSSLIYTYQQRKTAMTYKYDIDDKGASILQKVNIPNLTQYHLVNFNIKKFISPIKTTIGLKSNFAYTKGHNILNDSLVENRNMSSSIMPNVIISLTRYVHLEYSFNFNNIISYIGNEEKNKVSYFRHYCDIGIFPHRNHLVSLDTELYSHRGEHYVYVDLSYQYSIPKHKIDFELKCSNIFNNKSYVSYYSGAFSIEESIYEIRPMEIMCSMKFRF